MADDLIMESTTDSPEQIAEGLGVALEAADPVASPQGDGDPGLEEQEPVADDPGPVEEPVVEATQIPQSARQPRAQRKTADSAAAAARRKANAELEVLRAERDAYRDRLRALASGQEPPDPSRRRDAPVVAPVVTVDQVPDTHPSIAPILAEIAKLGPKPKQDTFADFDEFEEARDTWIENRARLRTRADIAREGVAQRESVAVAEANRAAAETAATFAQSVEAARSRHADYDDAMDQAREQGINISDDIKTALMESEVGGDIVYFLAKNPAEVARLNGMRPHRAVAEVGMLEARLRVTRQAGKPTLVAGNRPQSRITRAPEPQETTLGDLPGSGRPATLDDPNLSQADYNRLRDQMDVASGRRMATR